MPQAMYRPPQALLQLDDESARAQGVATLCCASDASCEAGVDRGYAEITVGCLASQRSRAERYIFGMFGDEFVGGSARQPRVA